MTDDIEMSIHELYCDHEPDETVLKVSLCRIDSYSIAVNAAQKLRLMKKRGELY